MDYLQLNDTQMPLVGLGCFMLHGKVLEDTLTCALQEGYELFDTAFKYSNEKEIGLFFTSQKSAKIIQTKVCARQLLGSSTYLWLNKGSIAQSYNNARKRFAGNSIDVFLIHSPFPKVEKYYKALLQLQEKEEIKIIGVCNFNIDQLKKIKDTTGVFPMLNQIEIHPYHSSKELISFCQDNGIIVEARSPFAHGDALKDWGSDRILQNLSTEYQKTVPQIILRWITQQKVVVLPRSTTQKHIKDNINIFDFKMTESQLLMIDKLNRNQSFGIISKL